MKNTLMMMHCQKLRYLELSEGLQSGINVSFAWEGEQQGKHTLAAALFFITRRTLKRTAVETHHEVLSFSAVKWKRLTLGQGAALADGDQVANFSTESW